MHCSDIGEAREALKYLRGFEVEAEIYERVDHTGIVKYWLGPLTDRGETVYTPATIQAVEKFMQE